MRSLIRAPLIRAPLIRVQGCATHFPKEKWVVELAAFFLSPFFIAGLAFCSLIAAIGEQVVDHSGIRQGRCVSQIVQFIGSNFAQNASHDLTRSSLG